MRPSVIRLLLGGVLCATPAAASDARLVRDAFSRCVNREIGNPLTASMIPHCRETVEVDGKKIEASFNALGLRDHDYAPARAGTLRILMVGDSVLANPTVSEEDSIPRRLEELLRERGLRAEVINAGVQGYASAQLAIRLPEELTAYCPDVVLYYLTNSVTVFSDAVYERYVERLPDGTPVAFRRNPLERLPTALRDFLYRSPGRIRAAYTIQELWDHFALSARVKFGGDYDRFFGPAVAHLTTMKRLTEARGADFLPVLLDDDITNDQNISGPMLPEFSRFVYDHFVPAVRVPAAALGERLDRTGIRYLRFPKLATPESRDPSGLHLAAQSNRLAADGIAQAFLAAGKFRAGRGCPKAGR